ncbi:uncharacterized protein LOC142356128, partial [Convolutriloba macropyga]|uniref:uncharacterized protein LOC142356128 n=1 Tax=Convolutriloba macropyga TaxID=536237 RepID=UPI003F51B209
MAMIRFLILLIIGLEIVDRQPKVAGLIIPEYTQFSFQLPSGDPKFCQLLRAPSVPFFPSQELFFQFCKNGYITLAGVGNFPLFRTLAEIESYFSQIETVIVAPGFIEDPLVSSQRARERRQAEDYFTQVLVQFTDIPSMEPFQNLLPGVTPTRGFFFKWTSFQFVEAGKRRKRRQLNTVENEYRVALVCGSDGGRYRCYLILEYISLNNVGSPPNYMTVAARTTTGQSWYHRASGRPDVGCVMINGGNQNASSWVYELSTDLNQVPIIEYLPEV